MATSYSQFVDNGNSMLPPFFQMLPGQYLQSRNGLYQLRLLDNADLALYQGETRLWSANSDVPYSNTQKLNTSKGTSNAHMRGTLELTDYGQRRQWSASPSTMAPEDYYKVYCVLQDDSNIVLTIFNTLWQSDAGRAVVPDARGIVSFGPGTEMEQGREYAAGDKTFVFQGDGNLVIYDANKTPLWHSQTYNQGGDKAVMQGDGNFVIYNTKENRPLWHSATYGNPGACAMVTDNGCFSIVDPKPIWARFGFTPTIVSGKPSARPGYQFTSPPIVIWTF